MSTKQRLEYFFDMPQTEQTIRLRIDAEKRSIKAAKELLRTWMEYKETEQDTTLALHCNGPIKLIRNEIKAHKRIIQLLKNGLPQRRPASVFEEEFYGCTNYKRYVDEYDEIHELWECEHCGGRFNVLKKGYNFCPDCGRHILKWEQ